MAQQLIINVENKNIVPLLKKMLSLMDGVSIARVPKKTAKTEKKKTGLDLAQEDIDKGRMNTYKNADELFSKFGI